MHNLHNNDNEPLNVLFAQKATKYNAKSNGTKAEPWGTPQDRDALDEA